ncbi:MAG: hypothetical protein AAB847_01870 [Patescibacteria group bacterium]
MGAYWQPTAYLEQTNSGQHSGQYTNGLSLNSDDENVLIAGGCANSLATADLFVHQVISGNFPQLLAWAAGRPRYLEQEPPELSEGSVLFKYFESHLKRMSPDVFEMLGNTRMEFQTKNRNTRDDLLQSLEMAKQMNLSKLIIISVFVHLRRIAEFYKFALQARPDFADIEVEFKASEMILFDAPDVQSNLFLEDAEVAGVFNDLAWAKIIESKVYRRTAAREAKGIEDLHAGRYKF